MSAISALVIAAVFISARTEGCSEAEVRLEGLGSREVGRVQVCEEGGWREVCVPATLSGRWRESNAAVVCRQLSYSSGALLATPDRLALAPGNSSMTSHVTCTGLENSLVDCPSTQAVDCGGSPAIVMCTNSPGAGSVRLIHLDEGSEFSGVVEVYVAGEWVGVCTDEWGREDSEVVCRQLGYPTGTPSNTRPHATVVRRLPRQRLNYFQCSGREASLLACDHTPYSSECRTSHYASVNCSHTTSSTSNDSDSDCPSVSVDVVMTFASVQLVVLGLAVLLNVVVLVAWSRWRRRGKVITCPEREGEFPPPPPSYDDISRDTQLHTSGVDTPTSTN